ncbi:MAG: O-antigen ligase family protein [Cytophagaceae bacterium]|nr:O-antigen ligase family protein [Cytophagaceae bacterium]
MNVSPSFNQFSRAKYALCALAAATLAIGIGAAIGLTGMVGAVGVLGIPVAIALLAGVLAEPRFGLLLYVHASFLLGFSRFLPPSDFPVGLVIDGILVVTLLSTFFHGKRMAWERLGRPGFLLIAAWFGYTLLEFFNPEAPYRMAWFAHIRAISLHWLLAALLALVIPVTRRDLRVLIGSWLVWSVFAAFWAYKQHYIGLADSEVDWLNLGNDKTHVLFGHLRCFSFYSDASQFGAEMAGVTLVCLIGLFEERTWWRRGIALVLAGLCFWAFALSGTRSALFVLIAGYGFYLVVKRDVVKLILGSVVSGFVFVLLMFTYLGQSNYQVARIRSALRPLEDPSFMVRLENQQKLAAYLKPLPFGAGIGTSSDAGLKYSPQHFAAQIPPDSWLVELWIETGIVGVSLYVLMLLTFITIGVVKVSRLNDPRLKVIMTALLAEFVGIAVMGYSNPVLGQFPTSSLIFINSVLFTTCDRWDTQPDRWEMPEKNVPETPRHAHILE